MTDHAGDSGNSGALAPLEDRLDSWKEIAAYLHRDVRTVQRWEKHAGLPVHRHAASRLRTAYAYRSELDAWWCDRRSVLDPATLHESSEGVPREHAHRPVRSYRRSTLVALAVLPIISGLLVLLHSFKLTSQGTPDGGIEQVPVVLATLEDQAGDPELTALASEAIAQELRSRPGIDPAPPARIRRALRLMRRDPSTVITEEIARELCLRDGGLAFAIGGRIHKLQSQYFVHLFALDPETGRVVVGVERQTTDRQSILAEAANAAAQIATDLGHTPHTSPPSFEPVTTASTPALRLYTGAVRAGARGEWGSAELLARRAVEVDDRFASAYAWTGWAIRRQGRARREALPWLDRAVALAGGTTDRENYFISGVHEAMARNLDAAMASFEALLRLQPRDPQALDLLITTYARAGRFKQAVELCVARAGYQPDDFYANVRAAHALLVWKGDAVSSAPYIRRAQELVSAKTATERPMWTAWISGLPVFASWIAGDRRQALDRLAQLDRTLDGRLGSERDAFAGTVGFGYLAFGKIHRAESALRRAGSPLRQIDLALVALALGQERRARDWLAQIRTHSALRPALFARVGMIAEAQSGLARLAPSEHDEGITAVAEGLIAASRRDDDAALAALRRGAERLQFSGEPEYFIAVEALAHLLRAHGDRERAVGWLNDAVAQRARTYGATQWTGASWIKVNAELASAYVVGEDAVRIRTSLQALLHDADTGHPLYAVLQPGTHR